MMSDEGDSDIESVLSSSEDDLEFVLNEAKVRNENYLEETIPRYSEAEFFEHFRISRNVVNDISARFAASPYYHTQSGQYGNITALNQVHIYLWYIGHQTASFRDVGDRFNVAISSINRIIQRVTLFLSNLSPQIIQWPNEDDKRASEEHFRNNGFPNIIGAIDGTHIRIDKPENDPESYINRKGYYSIHMQAVCDHRRRFTDIFIGYPGSVHDSRVFRNSSLKNTLEEKCGRYFLLGDSGYPLEANLLTPYKDRGNLSRRQINYNLKLAKNRYIIEHCFGILKQKFRQLYHIKLRSITLIVNFIRAACVLHNIAINDEFIVHEVPNMQLQVVAEQHGEEDDDGADAEIDVGIAVIRDRVANALAI